MVALSIIRPHANFRHDHTVSLFYSQAAIFR